VVSATAGTVDFMTYRNDDIPTQGVGFQRLPSSFLLSGRAGEVQEYVHDSEWRQLSVEKEYVWTDHHSKFLEVLK
jgi:hypothetical protein